jgi:signal transduction histidine kinase/ligand-binding sensor domain-containing protein
MWFGTEGGLARFDGRRTQVIKDPLLPGSRVLALQTDQEGALWVGTDDGAARMWEGQWQSLKETAGNVISAILILKDRTLLASEHGTVFVCESNSTTAKPLLSEQLQSSDRDQPGPLSITSLTNAGNRILAGSLSRGLLNIEQGRATEVRYRQNPFFIRALVVDKKGNLWAGARSRREEPGVLFGSVDNLERKDAPTGTVLSLQPIGDAMFAGTDGHGVFRFEGNQFKQFTFDGTAGGLRSDRVYAIFADREGVIWFGTDRGVSRFDPNAPRVEVLGAGDSNFVRSVLQTSNGQFFAGTNRGLFLFDEISLGWLTVNALPRQIIYALAESNDGRLLVGSASGFFVSQKLPGGTGEISFTRVESASGNVDAPGSVRGITNFRGTPFVASFGRGIEQYRDGRLRNVWPKEASSEVVSAFADDEIQLVVGTAKHGVLFFDGETAKEDAAFAAFKDAAVRGIVRTSDRTLWFATARGVYHCNTTPQCLPISGTSDARSLTPASGSNSSVWCATTGAGLLKINLDKDVGPIVSQIDTEQGLPSQNTFALTVAQNGDLVVGTNRGIVRYSPGTTIPTIYATRIISKRVHQPGELAAGLNLEYPQNSLLLDVSAISSRTFPEQFQYAFVLTDSAGNVVRQRLGRDSQFAMEGLKSGTYRVVARAFTKDLVASQPLTFQFNIASAPFPWTSTALAILLALTLAALLWALLERSRIVRTSKALVQANRELADARLSLANEAERERGRIARDLHDQTLADLRHLMLLTDQLSENGGNGPTAVDSSSLRSEIEGISQEVRRICEDLSPSVLQNVGFAAALEFSLSHAVQLAPAERKFDYEFDCEDGVDERTDLSPSVQMQIYRIVQEAVNNICRHAKPTHVKMVVSSSEKRDFVLQIEDDGHSFDPSESVKSDGRGLANMQARASLIDATISWEPRQPGGTVFTLIRKKSSADGDGKENDPRSLTKSH